LERFYDVLGGSVKLDFHDIRDLNVHWLRKQIGLVSQEPTLFACNIRDNIAYGNRNATPEQIEIAARMANAHDFIMSFPNGYDTQVGDKGAQISGGQKQRIAIARVLVKNPKILLLDESTSALDTESELIVQSALDSVVAEQKRTTIVIAHRLSTIRSADMICVVEEGRIIERGNHDELMALQGHYFKLVEAQQLRERVEGSSHSGPPSRNPSFVDLRESFSLQSTPVIMFRDVWFSYPSRPDVDIFRGLNLSVFPGESLALVGPSGHGKSTTVQLIERFYDPNAGSVELDGVDLREINVAWLREQFALVSQEPVLFDTSVKENIRLSRPDATMEEIESAARQANAYDFIVSFPDGFDTQVGEGGAAVSGGQKQRIAIARALLRRPRILLLDEATSALDSKSEEVVQKALDDIMTSKSLTTIVIAHRLSTVQKCDRIAVVAEGKVREIGTHDELMAIPDGRYRRMQAFQSLEGAEALSAPLRARTKLAGTDEHDMENIEIDEEDDDLAKEKEKSNARRARLLAKDDRWLFVTGGFGALLTGLTFPGWGICFAYVIDLLYWPVLKCTNNSDGTTATVVLPYGNETTQPFPCELYWDAVADDMKALSLNITWGLLGLMVVSIVGGTLLFYGFGKASEKMNKRVRNAAFDSLVRQEVGYFDLRPVGVITSQLQEDAALIHSFSGEPIRTLVINLSSVLVGVAISFAFMWPFALLALALIPPLGFGAEMEMKLYFGEDEGVGDDVRQNSPSGIVVETLVNIRTVASLTIEKKRSQQYLKALRAEDPTPIKTNFIKGCATGIGQFTQMWGLALLLWFGGWLLTTYPDTYTYRDYLISLFSLLFGLEGMGFAAQNATDRKKAKEAARRIFELIDRQSAIDPLSDEGRKTV
jgi:ATP-binding cassette subfamily B (MDR/TAP) protein 1